jgi:integrase
MKRNDHEGKVFRNLGECLYRFSVNGKPFGPYYARFKSDGAQIKRSLGTDDRALAKRKLAAFREEQRLVDRSQNRLTLSELCDRWLKTVRHRAPKTVVGKTALVERIKRHWPTGSLTQVGKIRPSECSIWLDLVANRKGRKRKFGPAARNGHIAGLKDVFAMAVRDGVIVKSPAEHLKKEKVGKPIRITPTFEQFKEIIANVRAQTFNGHGADESADFLEFMGLAGLGQAEASSLRRGDVDFDAGRIITFRHKTKAGFAIPLYPQVRPLLERLCEGKAHDEPVFEIANAKKALGAACRRLGYQPFSQRALRRMFITRAIERGVDVKVLADWQGHKDGGKLILQTYSHVNPVHSNRMAQLMTDAEPENVVPMHETEEKRQLRASVASGIVSIESMAEHLKRTTS